MQHMSANPFFLPKFYAQPVTALVQPGFDYIENWVGMKVRRHLMRARQRRGIGWHRWSTDWLKENLGLWSVWVPALTSCNSFGAKKYSPFKPSPPGPGPGGSGTFRFETWRSGKVSSRVPFGFRLSEQPSLMGAYHHGFTRASGGHPSLLELSGSVQRATLS